MEVEVGRRDVVRVIGTKKETVDWALVVETGTEVLEVWFRVRGALKGTVEGAVEVEEGVLLSLEESGAETEAEAEVEVENATVLVLLPPSSTKVQAAGTSSLFCWV